MDSKITFFSLNVGMSASLAGLNAIIKAENLDIIFLQEVRLSAEQIEQQLRGFKASVNIDESQTSNQELQLCGRNHHQMLMEGLDLFKRDAQLWRI